MGGYRMLTVDALRRGAGGSPAQRHVQASRLHHAVNEPYRIVASLPHSSSRSHMKLIIAIIPPAKVEAVKEALNKVEVFRLTMLDCRGFGRQKGHAETYRAHEL